MSATAKRARTAAKRRSRGILISIALTLVLVVLPLGLYLWGSRSPTFSIDRVLLTGCRQVGHQRALTLLEERFVGKNLFTVRAAQVDDALEPLFFVADVDVDRDFPATLRVRVSRARPGALRARRLALVPGLGEGRGPRGGPPRAAQAGGSPARRPDRRGAQAAGGPRHGAGADARTRSSRDEEVRTALEVSGYAARGSARQGGRGPDGGRKASGCVCARARWPIWGRSAGSRPRRWRCRPCSTTTRGRRWRRSTSTSRFPIVPWRSRCCEVRSVAGGRLPGANDESTRWSVRRAEVEGRAGHRAGRSPAVD